MTKERYFISILCAVFLPTLLTMIFVPETFSNMFSDIAMPAMIAVLLNLAFSVFVFSFVFAIGMYFAEKIGAKFVLLQDHYDLKKDIIKPALIVGVAASCIFWAIHVIFSVDLFYLQVMRTVLDFSSYKKWIALLGAVLGLIYKDIVLLLFWMSGFALLIKKLTRSSSMNAIMYTSIIIMSFLLATTASIWNVGIMRVPLDVWIACGMNIVLGVLFWKKGFEAAVLCHLIIAVVFYTVAPMLLALR